MLADVAHELHRAELDEPFGVVDHPRGVAAREIEKALELLPNRFGVGRHRVDVGERTFARLAARIADQASAAADERDRPMSVPLQSHEQLEIRHA